MRANDTPSAGGTPLGGFAGRALSVAISPAGKVLGQLSQVMHPYDASITEPSACDSGGQIADITEPADFFDVPNHPTATFASTRVERIGERHQADPARRLDLGEGAVALDLGGHGRATMAARDPASQGDRAASRAADHADQGGHGAHQGAGQQARDGGQRVRQ